MGGGDLNMKKSWHPVLLVNQEKVWKAEKVANDEKKKLSQLRKEQEEERQLAELQRMQEQATGKKRVDKLDWMYAAPTNEGGAMGGPRLGEREMEDYLLGKRRVDEVLKQGEQNLGHQHKEFIAVQNANTARDTAAKIREDPLLAIRQQEQAALAAMANRPEIRKKLKEMQKAQLETKDERRARRKAEKEDRRQARHEARRERHSHSYSQSYRDSRSPKSDYSDERDYTRSRRESHGSGGRGERGHYGRTRSASPRRNGDRRMGDSARGQRDESPRRSASHLRDDDRNGHSNGHSRDELRTPLPRPYTTNGHDSRDVKAHPTRPSALDMADRPISSSTSSRPLPPPNGNSKPLDEMRAARLAAMSNSAEQMYLDRTKVLTERAEEEKRQVEREEKMRAKYGKDDAHATFFKQQGGMGLSESLQRRAGKGLQRDF